MGKRLRVVAVSIYEHQASVVRHEGEPFGFIEHPVLDSTPPSSGDAMLLACWVAD